MAEPLFDGGARNQAILQWFKARVENIHSYVTAADVLARHGAGLKKHGGQEEQISCPFHGTDRKPSARYYPDSATSRSHVWCYVCREKGWDAVGLWRKFNSGTKFSESLFQIERAFGLTAPEMVRPEVEIDTYDPVQVEIDNLLDACDSRLIKERDAFDMVSLLKLGSILDRLRYGIERGELKKDQAKVLLTHLKDKIGEKVRAASISNSKP